MITRLKILLSQPEYSALLDLAFAELRDPASQVRWLVREHLLEKGLLHQETASDQEFPTEYSKKEQ